MINPIKSFTRLLGLLFITISTVNSQNLYDLQHSKYFAEYLFKAGDYKFAAEEYERLTFLSPQNDTFKWKLALSYRLSGDYLEAKDKLKQFFPDEDFHLKEIEIEYIRLLILLNEFTESETFTKKSYRLNQEDKLFYILSSEMMAFNFKEASRTLGNVSVFNDHRIASYKKVLNESQTIKLKSPVISAGFSTVLPGLGQVYTGNWKDGIFSFIFTASSAYQSYRGFKKVGIKSAYGWFYGSLAFGFYLGNIYGATKAAHKYNFQKKELIKSKIENIFYSDN